MGVLHGGQLFLLVLVPSLLFSWIAAVVLEETRAFDRYDGGAAHNGPIPDGTPQRIFWWMQVSDLHLSKFREPERASELKRFIETTVSAVDPAFVLVTGDLTDAKDEWLVDSIQYEEEWRTYDAVLRETGIHARGHSARHGDMRATHSTTESPRFWMDIRGNHDAFDVPSHHGERDFFSRFSSTRRHGYAFTFTTEYGSYRFVAMDATPAPGPRRPFNFFGVATPAEVDRLDTAVGPFGSHNHTVVYGHYPLSTVVSARGASGLTASQVISRTTAYVCGHLHTLLGIAPTLYVTHMAGFVELELGDWKENRRFRVMAVDNDLVSFVDAVHGEWPLVLVTNPKDARFLIPRREPVHRIASSTHVRALVFSPHEITSVTAKIDGKDAGGEFTRACGVDDAGEQEKPCALFVLPWNPSQLLPGTHVLAVEAVDSAGNRRVAKHVISVDGTRSWRLTMGEIILLPDYGLLLKIAFYVIYVLVTGGFLLAPWAARRRLARTNRLQAWREAHMALIVDQARSTDQASLAQTTAPHVERDADVGLVAWALRRARLLAAASAFRFVELAGVPSIHHPLTVYALYLLVGPWFMGELVRGDPFGCLFAHGVLVQGTFIPVAETYKFAAEQVLLALAPVVLHLSSRVATASIAAAHGTAAAGETQGRGRWRKRLYRVGVWAFLAFHAYSALDVYRWYGFIAFAVSPGKTWFLGLAYHLSLRAERYYETRRRETGHTARPEPFPRT